MISIPRPNTGSKNCEFFSKLFEARDVSHKQHLQTTSYAEHKALNDFYEEVLPLIDEIVEGYQGLYGLQKIDMVFNITNSLPIDYFTSLYKYIEENRHIFKESWIQNEIDNISKLVAKTLYKLKHLK